MAMRSLAFSVFILIMSLTYSLVITLDADLSNARNESIGYLRTATPPQSLTDLSWSSNVSTLDTFGLNTMANPQEIEGANYGKVSTTSILYTTLFYSTTGFDTFLRQVLGVNATSWDNTTIVMFIELGMVLVMLNHGFVLLQLGMSVLGVF